MYKLILIIVYIVAFLYFTTPQKVQAAEKPFYMPFFGTITSKFTRSHPGIDIAGKSGSYVRPISEGIIYEAGWATNGFGNTVVVRHPGEYYSTYAHLSKIYVTEGQLVTRSSILGLVGSTGHSTGPHTHLEIAHRNTNIDPVTVLNTISPLQTVTLEVKPSSLIRNP
jgi:murein DD-endopeptidase MepM/ murein hydrolase activator NlpD